MTRQRRWQKKQKALGRCVTCGKPAKTKFHCAFHAKEHSKRVYRSQLAKA